MRPSLKPDGVRLPSGFEPARAGDAVSVACGTSGSVGWLLYTMRDGIYFVPNVSGTFGTGA
ncbi:MAG: hypothetical protein M3N13_09680 [Candidatus Eremiobacteraeota bacterium]|nr:hypothetical protein [Candidatus Eremiobacteraeota bacterium]